MNLEQKAILGKKRILEYAEVRGNILKTFRHFGVSRSNFHLRRNAFQRSGDAGLGAEANLPAVCGQRPLLAQRVRLRAPDIRLQSRLKPTPRGRRAIDTIDS
jgi:hypothetical protein